MALFRLPGIPAVKAEPHIAARRGRAAETNLVPSSRVRVIDADCRTQQQARKKLLGGQTLPGLTADVVVLDGPQHRLLLIVRQLAKASAPARSRLLVDRSDALAPSFTHRRHP